jgi:hypothetical protein
VAIRPETVIEGCGEEPTTTTRISKTLVASVDLELTDAVRLGRTAKASKANDARVPEYLLDNRIMMSPKVRDVDRDDLLAALQVIRRGVLRYWKWSVAVFFYEWWKRKLKAARHAARSPPMRSLDEASKALAHAADASWWDWDRGSAPSSGDGLRSTKKKSETACGLLNQRALGS